MRGMRVQSIVQELRGEKIDIVEYSEDPEVFIRNALSPAKISRIVSNKEENHMTIIVADDQMSLAIGKKGQNVRLAAKLVKWKIDIKNQSESGGGLLEASGLLTRKESPTEDFLEIIKNAKGFGEKIVAILFTNNVVNFDEVISRGIEGLTQITGIGPKKAEAIFEFSQNYVSQRPKVVPVAEEIPAEGDDVDTAPQAEEEVETAEEDQEFPVSELADVDPAIIQILESNEFQTIAELSVTPIEELIVLEGIDEELATSLVEQARLHMEKFENV
jgi:N utilization substance protein A